MERKLPPEEAFNFYLSLGLKRSYAAVAEHFHVSKVAVTNCATREKWQERVRDMDAKARESTDRKALETREELIDRYLKMWSAVERRALEALRSYPLDSAMSAARALDLSMRNVLLLRGEPTERVENLEHIIRTEHERWQKHSTDDEEWADRLDDVPPNTASEDLSDGAVA